MQLWAWFGEIVDCSCSFWIIKHPMLRPPPPPPSSPSLTTSWWSCVTRYTIKLANWWLIFYGFTRIFIFTSELVSHFYFIFNYVCVWIFFDLVCFVSTVCKRCQLVFSFSSFGRLCSTSLKHAQKLVFVFSNDHHLNKVWTDKIKRNIRK